MPSKRAEKVLIYDIPYNS